MSEEVFSDGGSVEDALGAVTPVGSGEVDAETGISVDDSSPEVEPGGVEDRGEPEGVVVEGPEGEGVGSAVEPEDEDDSQEEPTETVMTRSTYLRSLLLMRGVPFPMVNEALATTALAHPEWDLSSEEKRPVSHWQGTIGDLD